MVYALPLSMVGGCLGLQILGRLLLLGLNPRAEEGLEIIKNEVKGILSKYNINLEI